MDLESKKTEEEEGEEGEKDKDLIDLQQAWDD